jgi:Protein tyrosine and serine/threonine kinase
VAPEVALGWAYNAQCDVFSFGILMWQIMGLSTRPYGTSNEKNSLQYFNESVWQGETVRPSMHFKNRIINEHFSANLQELVNDCWSHRWQNRPTMKTVEKILIEVRVPVG